MKKENGLEILMTARNSFIHLPLSGWEITNPNAQGDRVGENVSPIDRRLVWRRSFNANQNHPYYKEEENETRRRIGNHSPRRKNE
jgi:hypothetical protein